MGIILASKSPRRKALLEMLGIGPFRVIPSGNDEILSPGLTPEQTVNKLALEKAVTVMGQAREHNIKDDDMIVAADTLVCVDGHFFGKPESERAAMNMLRALSGRKHTVYTGVALVRGGVTTVSAESTDVYFRDISGFEILKYVKSGDPMDKAGAYGAQGYAAVFIEKIEGDFFNVMGLPLCRLSVMLRGFGVFL